METIEQRGVGSAVLRMLQEKAGGKAEAIEEREFARALAEWADGDSAAHTSPTTTPSSAPKIGARALEVGQYWIKTIASGLPRPIR
jgi:hypothetical protein